MAVSDERTINLAHEQAVYIDFLVSTGRYASASEVVQAGLRALEEQDGMLRQWLKEAVAPVYDSMEADPSRGIGLDDVQSKLHSHHLERTKKV